jgi:ABC-2 type transport system permease protein
VVDAPPTARRPVEERPVRIVSARPSLRRRLQAIWDARELLAYFVVTDVKIKYKSSALGLLWSLVAPTLTLAIYWLVFGFIIHANPMPDYVVFLGCGLLVWGFFSAVVNTSTGIVVDRASVVKKVAFPREILALSTVGTTLIFFFMQAIVLVLFMVVTRHAPDWSLLWLLPIALVAISVFAATLGIVLSAVNVYLRDTKHLVEVILQLWFFLTPILYSFEYTLSQRLHKWNVVWLYLINPVAPVVMSFQRVLYANEVVKATSPVPATPGLAAGYIKVLPTWPVTTYLALDVALLLISCAAMFGAVAVFGRLEGNFAEEL